MSELAIQVKNLSKRYVLGHQRDSRDGLRHALEASIRNPFKWMASQKRQIGVACEEFWALKDVSIEIKQGEVVGFVGRNGAGKSTLLKILSRITEPTTGRVEIHGRVASLLEVGTGFHAELTGRENIFLNGAILGMAKAEIKRKFDEIVAFAEIEKFLDTPVKRYSSGMYVRLAFAVAAHLEPEILIVDEVLAVGDAQFQKKCLGKMRDISGKEGRTVLFVSHNTAAVKALCTRAIVLAGGSVRDDGSPDSIMASYLNEKTFSNFENTKTENNHPSITKVWFSDSKGSKRASFAPGEPIVVNAEIYNPNSEKLNFELGFFDGAGSKIWNFIHEAYGVAPIAVAPHARVAIHFAVPTICIEDIFVHVGLRRCETPDREYVHHITEGLRFSISTPTNGTYERAGVVVSCPVKFNVAAI
jgi:lipopolysaccharide transport system ATP-binding protein